MDTKAVFTYLRPVSVLFIILTVCSVLYLGFVLVTAYQGLDSLGSGQVQATPEVPPLFDLNAQPDETALEAIRSRDLFSAAPAQAPDQQVPTEQLPANLKVVAIVIAGTPQIVVEDTTAQQTYFVSEGKPAGGIALRHADRHTIIIDYQGQNIALPVSDPTQPPMVPANVQIP